MRNIVALLILMLIAASPALAGSVTWETPWPEARGYALAKCAEVFDNFQLQKVCLENDREGHRALQGDYGMPPVVARKAKARCAEVFEQFQLQDVCMQNEAEAYKKLYGQGG